MLRNYFVIKFPLLVSLINNIDADFFNYIYTGFYIIYLSLSLETSDVKN